MAETNAVCTCGYVFPIVAFHNFEGEFTWGARGYLAQICPTCGIERPIVIVGPQSEVTKMDQRKVCCQQYTAKLAPDVRANALKIVCPTCHVVLKDRNGPIGEVDMLARVGVTPADEPTMH